MPCGIDYKISNDELWRNKTYPPENAKIVLGGRLPELRNQFGIRGIGSVESSSFFGGDCRLCYRSGRHDADCNQ